MQKAHELAQAKKSGDLDRIKEAELAHDAYKKLCLQADEMTLGTTIFNLIK